MNTVILSWNPQLVHTLVPLCLMWSYIRADMLKNTNKQENISYTCLECSGVFNESVFEMKL